MDINFNGIPVFKGLQKPLEFMGIRGRFLKLVGFIIMVVLIAVGIISIYVKQRSGLHSKKRHRGNFYYCKMYEH